MRAAHHPPAAPEAAGSPGLPASPAVETLELLLRMTEKNGHSIALIFPEESADFIRGYTAGQIDALRLALDHVRAGKKSGGNQMDKTDEKPLCVNEAAELTGYSKGYIYQLIHFGKIPYHKPTGSLKSRVFFKKSELLDFIYRNKKSTDYEISETASTILNGEK